MDGVRWSELAMNLLEQEVVTHRNFIVVQNMNVPEDKYVFVHPHHYDDFSAELLLWFQKYFDGSLLAYRKSAAVPKDEDNPGPLYTVVFSNFEEVVMANSFVFVLFHMPWSRHSNKVLAIVQKIAAEFPERGHKDVKFVVMDARLNTLPIQLDHYPAFFLYAPNEDEPVKFDHQGHRFRFDTIERFYLKYKKEDTAEVDVVM